MFTKKIKNKKFDQYSRADLELLAIDQQAELNSIRGLLVKPKTIKRENHRLLDGQYFVCIKAYPCAVNKWEFATPAPTSIPSLPHDQGSLVNEDVSTITI